MEHPWHVPFHNSFPCILVVLEGNDPCSAHVERIRMGPDHVFMKILVFFQRQKLWEWSRIGGRGEGRQPKHGSSSSRIVAKATFWLGLICSHLCGPINYNLCVVDVKRGRSKVGKLQLIAYQLVVIVSGLTYEVSDEGAV